MGMIEVEKKFLARASFLKLYRQARASGATDAVQKILQGYLWSGKHSEVRLRYCRECDSADYRIGFKFGNGFKRIELEYDLPGKLFWLLMQKAKYFNKTRLQVGEWNVDFFIGGALEGLVLAEHEHMHDGDERSFELPPLPEGLVLGRDVTEARTFANKNLAKLNEEEAKALVAYTNGSMLTGDENRNE